MIILFSVAVKEEKNELKVLFNLYQGALGKKFNFEKLEMMFRENVKEGHKRKFQNWMLVEISNRFEYL